MRPRLSFLWLTRTGFVLRIGKRSMVGLLTGALLASLTLAASAMAEEISFDQQIRPVLSDKCFTCHGPDAEHREADLRLDREEVAKQAAIVPGNAAKSELYLRVSSTDDDFRMPPPDSKLSLNQQEIELLRRWIDQGAVWKKHWAFSPLQPVRIPEVKERGWLRNEIDAFIAAELERVNLTPSPPANRETLIRRLTFDLTGLPPSRDEVQDFRDDPSANASEKVVDRLLKSQRYGERMAADWLDVARYSDTYGYQVDRDRFVWPWRDWVIRAFNQNMHYDEFITQQLAGDLLPQATDDQILATTFNRLHPQKVEGGSIPEEFRVEYVADRTQTFATGLLGLTLECARCHDHKYDPITQKEYYQLFAFFNNIDEAGLYSYFTSSVPTPTLQMMDDATKKKVADVERRIAEQERELARLADSRRDALAAWRKSPRNPEIPERIALLDFENPPAAPNKSAPGRIGKAVQLTGDDGIALKVGNFRRYDPFSVALWMKTPDMKQRAVVFHRSRAWTDAGSRGYQLLIEDGRLNFSLIHFWPGNAISVRTPDPLPTEQWLHVALTYDGSSRADGLRIYLNGKMAATQVVRDHLYKNITGGGGDNITIGERFRDRGFTNGMVDEFQVFSRQLTSLEVAHLHDANSLATALKTEWDALPAERQAELYEYYLSTADESYRQQMAQLRETRSQRSQLVDGLQEIMVMRERKAGENAAYLLKRGAYDAPGDRVHADTPAVFPAFPQDQPRNRLGLARWMTDPQHPLTARVAVNRLWQMCFGYGLVRTPEDFGSQGQPPSHPQLLDWLARDFMTHDWDTKRLLKKIVMSATYRQSSQASAALRLRDPDNRLWARGPSYRLSAEMLRDSALAESGLLVEKLGGPPARPYELEASFKPVGRDKGEGLYRRSVYTYWKRTAPAPAMMTLDASKRNVCRVRRERTSSPLQALVLLNGPQYVEAARMLAQKLVQQQPRDEEAILQDIFSTLTSRAPSSEESEILMELYRRQLADFQQHPERAEQFLKTGDAPYDRKLDRSQLAAFAAVANTLMNYDECVMKR